MTIKMSGSTRLPLGENEVITEEAAKAMVGQEYPIKIFDLIQGIGQIVFVDWRSPTEVHLCLELDVEDVGDALKLKEIRGFSIDSGL